MGFSRGRQPASKGVPPISTVQELNIDDFLSDSIPNEIGEIRQFELQHDPRSVAFYSAHTDAQLLGDLPIHFALS